MGACPCGSEKAFDRCCEPLLKKQRQADTAEELMRSRYTAYTRANVGYIVETTHPDVRDELDERGIRSWAEKSEWLGLDIQDSSGGGAEDTEGSIEFIASYSEKNNKKIHHEQAHFEKVDGVWYFKDGVLVKPKQFIRSEPKIGRNEPCPCKSGKKYKKCCGI